MLGTIRKSRVLPCSCSLALEMGLSAGLIVRHLESCCLCDSVGGAVYIFCLKMSPPGLCIGSFLV